MRKLNLVLVLLGIWGCDFSKSHKKAAETPPTDEKQKVLTLGSPEVDPQLDLCLSKVTWEQALSGTVDMKILVKVFSSPSDPQVQQLVTAAREGKANCP